MTCPSHRILLSSILSRLSDTKCLQEQDRIQAIPSIEDLEWHNHAEHDQQLAKLASVRSENYDLIVILSILPTVVGLVWS